MRGLQLLENVGVVLLAVFAPDRYLRDLRLPEVSLWLVLWQFLCRKGTCQIFGYWRIFSGWCLVLVMPERYM